MDAKGIALKYFLRTNGTIIVSFLFVGMIMTVYQLSIYATLNAVVVDISEPNNTCKAQTVIYLLLANSMVDLAACLVSTLGSGFAIFLAMPGDPPGYESIELRAVNICNWVVRGVLLSVNVALMISMSVMVWGAQCSTLSTNYFYQYMTVLLIIEWLHPLAVIAGAGILVGVIELALLIRGAIQRARGKE
jgi:hypothetical protein